jgi:hypothetical protein
MPAIKFIPRTVYNNDIKYLFIKPLNVCSVAQQDAKIKHCKGGYIGGSVKRNFEANASIASNKPRGQADYF